MWGKINKRHSKKNRSPLCGQKHPIGLIQRHPLGAVEHIRSFAGKLDTIGQFHSQSQSRHRKTYAFTEADEANRPARGSSVESLRHGNANPSGDRRARPLGGKEVRLWLQIASTPLWGSDHRNGDWALVSGNAGPRGPRHLRRIVLRHSTPGTSIPESKWTGTRQPNKAGRG